MGQDIGFRLLFWKNGAKDLSIRCLTLIMVISKTYGFYMGCVMYETIAHIYFPGATAYACPETTCYNIPDKPIMCSPRKPG